MRYLVVLLCLCGLGLVGCPSTGSLTVTIEPDTAAAEAEWRLDGGDWMDPGATLADLDPGEHTLSFSYLYGWTKPQDQAVTIEAGETATATGTYVEVGALTVTLEPTDAEGAQWRLDDGEWRDSGVTLTELPPGPYTISFSDVENWQTPASQTVAVTARGHTFVTGTYVFIPQVGSLTVLMGPTSLEEARWRIEDGEWMESGDTLVDIDAGTYTVLFDNVLGWIKPTSQQAVVQFERITLVQAEYTEQLTSDDMVVLGYSDFGAQRMDPDFAYLMMFPPYNTLHAQVIDRSGASPRLVTSDAEVRYSIPSSSTSSDKVNFWEHSAALLGAALPDNIGLEGNGLSGAMTYASTSGRSDWGVKGIPLTPTDDGGATNSFPLALITVAREGEDVVQAQAVLPVTSEMKCYLCHLAGDDPYMVDILRDHDRLHDTNFESNPPVACGNCHAQAELGFGGDSSLPSLSRAMHGSHATRMENLALPESCMACHGSAQAYRGLHFQFDGVRCASCHEDMTALASPSRVPWQDVPRCGDCHQAAPAAGIDFEQPGVPYRDSKGHSGIHCAACHGAPHALVPSGQDEDNLQALVLQGVASPIGCAQCDPVACDVCHSETPSSPFSHRYDEDKPRQDGI